MSLILSFCIAMNWSQMQFRCSDMRKVTHSPAKLTSSNLNISGHTFFLSITSVLNTAFSVWYSGRLAERHVALVAKPLRTICQMCQQTRYLQRREFLNKVSKRSENHGEKKWNFPPSSISRWQSHCRQPLKLFSFLSFQCSVLNIIIT